VLGSPALLPDAAIGIALAPQDGTNRDQLSKNADLADLLLSAPRTTPPQTIASFEPAMG